MGKAQQAYAVMPADVTPDCDERIAAILRRYGISEETYCQLFRAAKLATGESQRELMTRLHDLAGHWAKSYVEVKDVLDLVVKEQFVSTLPNETCLRESECKPKRSEEAGDMAED